MLDAPFFETLRLVVFASLEDLDVGVAALLHQETDELYELLLLMQELFEGLPVGLEVGVALGEQGADFTVEVLFRP